MEAEYTVRVTVPCMLVSTPQSANMSPDATQYIMLHAVVHVMKTVSAVHPPASFASDGLFAPTRLPTLIVAAVDTPKGKLM